MIFECFFDVQYNAIMSEKDIVNENDTSIRISNTDSRLVMTKIMLSANEHNISVLADCKGEILREVGGYFARVEMKSKGLQMVVFNFLDPDFSDQWDILDECFDPEFKIIDVEKTREFVNDILSLFDDKFDDDFSNLLLFSILLSYYHHKYELTNENAYNFEISDIIDVLKDYKEHKNEFIRIASVFELENLSYKIFYKDDVTKSDSIEEQVNKFVSYFTENRLSLFSSKGISCSEVSTKQATYFVIYDEFDGFSNGLTLLFLKYVWRNAVRQRSESMKGAIPLKFFACENIGVKNKKNLEDFAALVRNSKGKNLQIWEIGESTTRR